MKKTTLILIALATVAMAFTQKNQNAKFLQDKEAIKSLVGCYKVTFEFAETFAPDTAYKYYDRKFEWGIEKVFIVEETENRISLQHILIVNDTFIVKHWRQDWIYENKELLSYTNDNKWIKTILSNKEAKGTWTQKVYQVDDSPRYEGYGTWVHVDGRHFWQSTTDAPLPRREFTIRSDYNILKRHSKIELTDYGWILEQDNEKINRTPNGDVLVCWEKGFEKFYRGDFDCSAADEWWSKNQHFWSDVRAVWEDVVAKNKQINLEKKIDEKPLFSKMFSLGETYSNHPQYNPKEARKEIKEIIELYLLRS